MRPRIFRIWNIKPFYTTFELTEALDRVKVREYADWFGPRLKDISFQKLHACNQLKRFQRQGAFNGPGEYQYIHWQENGALHYDLYKAPIGALFIP